MVFGQQLFQIFESNWSTTCEIRVDDFPRIRINGRLENYSEPENFTGRIIFMSMFNDIVWDAKGNDESCVNDSKTNKEYAERFLRGLSFLEAGSEKKWCGTYDGKPDGCSNRIAEKMLQNFEGSDHPIFRCTNPLQRVQLRSKGGGETSIHFKGSMKSMYGKYWVAPPDGHLRQSAQFFYGAVADRIAQLPVGRRAPGKPVASGQLDRYSYTISSRRNASQWRATGKRRNDQKT